ncbi:LexA repressor [Halomonadaceae bacterium LMG 33818]|uniref:transcriptional repressor LexA n=1 Tax=Cernens ardua TaxID=3402176 RepID=UPI003EDB9678
MTRPLTRRQQEVLDLITETVATHGYPPTRAEIARSLGFRSANAAEEHLKALKRKGVIEMIPGASRGIRVVSSHLAKTQGGDEKNADKRSTDKKGAPSSQHTTAKFVTPQQEAANASDAPAAEGLAIIGQVAAGSPVLAQEHVDRYCPLPPTFFSPKADYLLRVKGLSMQDIGILDGDLLAVHRTSDVRNGQIVVARIGEDVTVKRFERKGSKIRLLAENADFAPIEVDPSQGFEIEGIGVGVIRGDQGSGLH